MHLGEIVSDGEIHAVDDTPAPNPEPAVHDREPTLAATDAR